MRCTGLKMKKMISFGLVCLMGFGSAGTSVKAAESKESLIIVETEDALQEAETQEKDSGEAVFQLPQVAVRAHVQGIGWMDAVSSGEISGTVGEYRRLEALEVQIESEAKLGIAYDSYSQTTGWQEMVKNGEPTGSVGKSRALEAVSFRLIGEDKDAYKLYYRVYTRERGWMGWTRDGGKAGTEGFLDAMEAVELRLLRLEEDFPMEEEVSYEVFQEQALVGYSVYRSATGWLEEDEQKNVNGLIENVRVTLDTNKEMALSFSLYEATLGWTTSEVVETLEQALIQGLKISLIGPEAEEFDVYYRMKLQDFGWMDYAFNGQGAGTDLEGIHVEDVEILLAKKGTLELPTTRAFMTHERPYEVSYAVHVQKHGWMEPSIDGAMAGTLENLRMEALKITLHPDLPEGSIHYQVHSQSYGWMEPVKDGALGGTQGEGKRMEAFRISLSGALEKSYDVYYRSKVEGLHWFAFAKNGETSGTEGLRRFIEAVEILLVPKGEVPMVHEGPVNILPEELPLVAYRSLGMGFEEGSPRIEGVISGTQGRSMALKNVAVEILGHEGLHVAYEAYKTDIGWERSPKGELLETENRANIEALRFELHGKEAGNYNLYYRVHIQSYGWLDWTKDGYAAGSVGKGLRLEAFEMKLKKKEAPLDVPMEKPFIVEGPKVPINVRAHIQRVGWVNGIDYQETIGTVGQSLRLEALEMNLASYLPGGELVLGGFVKGLGYTESSTGTLVGSTGLGRPLEDLNITLTGYLGEVFDVYYRVHVSKLGWLGWATNGEKAGTAFHGHRVEALEMKLLPKGEGFEEAQGKAFIIEMPKDLYVRFLERNDSYTRQEKINPQGLMIHSTAVPGVMAKEWFSRWNKSYDKGETNRQVSAHAFIDHEEIWQYLPWDHRGWHAGGTANNTHIGVEMVEPPGHRYVGNTLVGYDPVRNAAFFKSVYERTIALAVVLARMYNFNHQNIISHNEGGKQGIAAHSQDVEHWFPYHQVSMDTLRKEVQRRLGL